MVIFCIPVRASQTSSNWKLCQQRLFQTLCSIKASTGEFKCIVAGNDRRLESFDWSDKRFEYIQADLKIPSNWLEMSRDKFWKLTMIGARVKEIILELEDPTKGIYIMPVDADDLINRNVAKWCSDFPDEAGLVSNYGYIWKEGSHILEKYKDMHEFCGSCNIIRVYENDFLAKDELDNSLSLDYQTAKLLNQKLPIRFDHNKVVSIYQKAGKEFRRLPDPTTIYRRETGDNISSKVEIERDRKGTQIVSTLRKLKLTKYKFIGPKIKSDFQGIFNNL